MKKKNGKELLNCWNLLICNALDPRKCNEKEKRIRNNVTGAHESCEVFLRVYAKYTNTVTPLLSVPLSNKPPPPPALFKGRKLISPPLF